MLKMLVFPFIPNTHATPGLDRKSIPEILGGKGGNVAVMTNQKYPVPPGFTITTEVCTYFYTHGRSYPPELTVQVQSALEKVEAFTDRRFGDPVRPLLVSVRSGARASMPGMMDTVLNVGLNDQTVIGLAKLTSDWRFALDCYRRLIQMYGDVVLGIDKKYFDKVIESVKLARAITVDTDLGADDWQEVISRFKEIVLDLTGSPFPQDPHQQLWGAIGAVFGSWMNPRAVTYRELESIPHDWGTAVTVQTMVFGNMGDDCATGVAFTRNPSTGEREIYGEFLSNAQGEDVVAGIRTPRPLIALKDTMPKVYEELLTIMQNLESHFRDMQDVEFTIENGKLWMLQTRSGKRTVRSAIKIAVDMVDEGLITSKTEAVKRIKPTSLDQLFHPIIDPAYKGKPWLKGLPASPGAVCGRIVFSAEDAIKQASKGEQVILVREETCPDDIGGMHAAIGILTARGGMTSHAAVVARGMGKPCVAGASGLRVDHDNRKIIVNGDTLSEGDLITFDGMTGHVYRGEIKTIEPTLPTEYFTLMRWADGIRRLKVRTNAETPADARKAREMGAEGIGLCRTEHMFFGEDRIPAVVEMIMAETEVERRAALDKLLPMQRADFVELFEIMCGLPVTIRLLDPPLHEFLPKTDEDFEKLTKKIGKTADAIRARARALHETNPMLGLRGVRLGIVYPEIIEMQARAILGAAIEANYSINGEKLLEIMVPLVNFEKEFGQMAAVINRVYLETCRDDGPIVLFKIGTMLELPRACVVAGKLAEHGAEFFSFGTNDLTQTALGISRDDAGTFLGHYVEKGIIPADPFVTIDVDGVGHLIELAVDEVRCDHPGRTFGICGEHGGDPDSIAFFDKVGLDYVSCSPYRVPIARLAAAQVAVKNSYPEKGRRAKAIFS